MRSMEARSIRVRGSASGEGLRLVLFEFGEDEGVDFGALPGGLFDCRGRQFVHGLEGPPLAAFVVIDDAGGSGNGGGSGGRDAWVFGSGLDPFFEIGDHGGGKLAGGRHLEVRVVVAEGADEAAVFGFAGDDGGAGGAAGACRLWCRGPGRPWVF